MPQSGYPRNVQIYSRVQQDAPELVAGFMQFGRTTAAELYSCLEICFARPRPGDFRLCADDGNILSRQVPDHIVPINDLYVVSLSIYCSHYPPNDAADPATYLDVELTVHAAEPRNLSGGTPNTPNGSVCIPNP